MGDTKNTTADDLRAEIRRYGNNAKLARIVGTTRQTINSFLRGGGLRLETFLTLCKVLGLTPPRLIEITVQKSPGRNPPMIFTESQLKTVPDKMMVTEQDALLLMELQNTSNPYQPIRLAVLILESGKAVLPEADDAARRAVVAVIGLLSAYMK